MNRCLRCFRAGSTCYCAEIRVIEPKTQIVILRHTRERKRSVGTAQMTHLMLKGSRLFTDRDFSGRSEISEVLANPEHHCVVLFPGPTSQNLETQPLQTSKRLVVFVIDGTWIDARQILRQNPDIASLPRISFQASKTSEYQFRKQPAEYCLSTVESIHRVLGILEPELDAECLLDVFRSLVKTQLKFSENDIVRMPAGRARSP